MSKQPELAKEFLSSFGRRIGRPLGSVQQALAEKWLPEIGIELPKGEQPLSLNTLFGDDQPVHLEIGFGGGEHLAGRAERHPHINFIGCEPFMNGVGKCLQHIDERQLLNIRLYYQDDARFLVKQLPDACIEQIYILFPDPWRKPRHHKRRIVSQETLDMLARIQPKGGKLLLATDHENYKAWMLEHVLQHPHYEWSAQQQSDWNEEPEGWIRTRYQEKTMKQGRRPLFIDCTRI